MPQAKLCPCGEPLHYISRESERKVLAQVESLGEFIPVSLEWRTWLVSRHYIALHGLRAVDLPAMGFAEVCQKCRKPMAECPEGKCG